MERVYQTLNATNRTDSDRFDATVGSIGFVLHRHKPAGWSIANLANPNYDILAYALAGRAWYACENERFEATQGTMLFFPRGVAHSARSDPQAPWSFYSVGFRLEAPASAHEAIQTLPHRLRMANEPQITDLFSQLQRAWTTKQAGYAMACRGLLLMLLQHYVVAAERSGPRRVPHHDRLQVIVQRLHDNIGRTYSVGELARQARLSESRFRLLFGQFTGCSIVQYQNRLRIQAARDLLASGQFSVSEVARELGFRDVYYFSRLFKRMTGAPPSASRPN